MTKPYLTERGTLFMPMDVEAKYKWWMPGGQSLEQTLFELGASQEILDCFIKAEQHGVVFELLSDR